MDADFTRQAAELVAANDRVPQQRRKPDSRPIEPAGTVIELELGGRFVSNGYVWLACNPAPDRSAFVAWSAERLNRGYAWWAVARPAAVSPSGDV